MNTPLSIAQKDFIRRDLLDIVLDPNIYGFSSIETEKKQVAEMIHENICTTLECNLSISQIKEEIDELLGKSFQNGVAKNKLFKEIARNKQARYFEKNHKIKEFDSVKRKPRGYSEPVFYYIPGLLKWKDAKDGKIFYKGYRDSILKEIEDLKDKGLYAHSGMMMSHTLRSEHIPWNVFYPMSMTEESKENARDVFNSIIQKVSPELSKIAKITAIKIEFAPEPKVDYLGDGTSFDTYIEYVAEDGLEGGIGIEVKYTEEGYRPSEKEKTEAILEHKKHLYWDVMKYSHYYIPDAENGQDGADWSPLVSNDLRQIWRNHLLGASMVRKGDISHFLSLHLYPSGNTHFYGENGAVAEYKKYLSDNGKKTWTAVTFEELFQLIRDNFKSQEHQVWVSYLESRYFF